MDDSPVDKILNKMRSKTVADNANGKPPKMAQKGRGPTPASPASGAQRTGKDAEKRDH